MYCMIFHITGDNKKIVEALRKINKITVHTMIKKYNGTGSLNTKMSASRRWSIMITKYKGTLYFNLEF